jgi:hypothetical protein
MPITSFCDTGHNENVLGQTRTQADYTAKHPHSPAPALAKTQATCGSRRLRIVKTAHTVANLCKPGTYRM